MVPTGTFSYRRLLPVLNLRSITFSSSDSRPSAFSYNLTLLRDMIIVYFVKISLSWLLTTRSWLLHALVTPVTLTLQNGFVVLTNVTSRCQGYSYGLMTFTLVYYMSSPYEVRRTYVYHIYIYIYIYIHVSRIGVSGLWEMAPALIMKYGIPVCKCGQTIKKSTENMEVHMLLSVKNTITYLDEHNQSWWMEISQWR